MGSIYNYAEANIASAHIYNKALDDWEVSAKLILPQEGGMIMGCSSGPNFNKASLVYSLDATTPVDTTPPQTQLEIVQVDAEEERGVNLLLIIVLLANRNKVVVRSV